MAEGDSTVNRLDEEFKKRIPMLSINTVPDWVLKEFLKLTEEYEGDRGAALTALLMDRKVMNAETMIMLMQELDERIRKLEGLNGIPRSHEPKTIRLANGREITLHKLGGKEDG